MSTEKKTTDVTDTTNPSPNLDRRAVLGLAASAVAASMLPGLATAATIAADVTIKTGAVRGMNRGGIWCYRGIPFARPPVGPLRFKPPVPIEPWTGVRDATKFGPAPLQNATISLNGQDRPTVRDNTISEDCLYLNVWAPETPGPHPVFVWIFGGGNVIGTTSDALYDCEAMARQGIVCVSPAYRVGALGFLELSSLLGQDYAGSGNIALLDLLLGLHWVRDNIAAFGGDPNQVTIGGPSAAAVNITSLLAMPSSDGLFERVAVFSGGQRVHSAVGANDLAARFLKATGLKPSKASKLLALSPPEILAAQDSMADAYPVRMPFRSVVDGTLLPETPLRALRAGRMKSVPIFLNTVRDEAALRRGHKPSDPVDPNELTYASKAEFDRQIARYREAFPQLPAEEISLRAMTAEGYWIPMVRTAEAHIAGGGVAYMSRFDFSPGQGDAAAKPMHGMDLRFWLNNGGAQTILASTPDPDTPKLTKEMHAALASFIKTGTPTLPQGPKWPPYDPAKRSAMVFDRKTSVQKDPRGDERKLWDDFTDPMIFSEA